MIKYEKEILELCFRNFFKFCDKYRGMIIIRLYKRWNFSTFLLTMMVSDIIISLTNSFIPKELSNLIYLILIDS